MDHIGQANTHVDSLEFRLTDKLSPNVIREEEEGISKAGNAMERRRVGQWAKLSGPGLYQ